MTRVSSAKLMGNAGEEGKALFVDLLFLSGEAGNRISYSSRVCRIFVLAVIIDEDHSRSAMLRYHQLKVAGGGSTTIDRVVSPGTPCSFCVGGLRRR